MRKRSTGSIQKQSLGDIFTLQLADSVDVKPTVEDQECFKHEK